MSKKIDNPYEKINVEETTQSLKTNKKPRRKRERVVNTTFTMTPTHREKLAKRAEEEGISSSELLRELIDEHC